MNDYNDWKAGAVTAEEAVGHLRSGMKVSIHGAAATRTPLIDALAANTALDDITTYHLHLEGRVAIVEPRCAGRIRPTSLFTGASMREAINAGQADFTPVFVSDIPLLFTCGSIPLDAALLQLSPPDKHGYCTVGTSADRFVERAGAAVTPNRRKTVHPGRITTSFAVGSKRLYDFVDDNAFVEFYSADHTNDTAVIRRNDNVVAVNSAIEVDLSGQVV